MAPADENECRQMLYTAYQLNGPAAVRYPRGNGLGVAIEKTMTALPLGKAEVLRRGKAIALLAFGSMLAPALTVGDELNTTVVNMRFIKPLDETLILELAHTHDLLVTLEENTVQGGAGSAINEFLAANGRMIDCLNLGLPDEFIEHGERSELLHDCGLDAAGIRHAILQRRPLRVAGRAESA
jgi:1-deoxy-D-xylulose-5-phosphate synthase